MKAKAARAASWVMCALLAAGCDGPQSALDPAGAAAEQIATLWWWMAGGAALIWVAVVGLTVYAIRVRPEKHDERKAGLLIIGGGAVFPTVVLAGLLVYGLGLMPGLLAPGEEGLEIHVTGEEWWWRVEYRTAGGDTVELANEIRLPVGRRTQLVLESPDVIHSFWIPSLGGKMDMIPGRTTWLALEPTHTGTFRGTCAEYCGTSHAFMSFVAVVMEPAEFEAWLEDQARPAGVSSGGAGPAAVAGTADSVAPAASPGLDAFLTHGCAACHTVRGTPADGRVGPDLTHVGGRETLAAGMLPNDVESFYRWISAAQDVKPGVHMPSFGMLPQDDLRAIARWLESLE